MAIRDSEEFNLSIPCRIAEVRPASAALRQFLQSRGFCEEELSACELAIVEALNNAIQYVSPDRGMHSVKLEAVCNADTVLFRVTDHTPGFILKERIELPPFDAERGRGLFLIKSAMDKVHYACRPESNCLTMQKKRRTR